MESWRAESADPMWVLMKSGYKVTGYLVDPLKPVYRAMLLAVGALTADWRLFSTFGSDWTLNSNRYVRFALGKGFAGFFSNGNRNPSLQIPASFKCFFWKFTERGKVFVCWRRELTYRCF
jgi:hypothetical protein